MTKEQEEAIEKLEHVNRYYDCNNYYSRYELDCIEIVLNMLKEKDKRIKELEEEKNNSIPIKKIKDKIKELANTKGDLATYIATSERIKVLEELLEEK